MYHEDGAGDRGVGDDFFDPHSSEHSAGSTGRINAGTAGRGTLAFDWTATVGQRDGPNCRASDASYIRS